MPYSARISRNELSCEYQLILIAVCSSPGSKSAVYIGMRNKEALKALRVLYCLSHTHLWRWSTLRKLPKCTGEFQNLDKKIWSHFFFQTEFAQLAFPEVCFCSALHGIFAEVSFSNFSSLMRTRSEQSISCSNVKRLHMPGKVQTKCCVDLDQKQLWADFFWDMCYDVSVFSSQHDNVWTPLSKEALHESCMSTKG